MKILYVTKKYEEEEVKLPSSVLKFMNDNNLVWEVFPPQEPLGSSSLFRVGWKGTHCPAPNAVQYDSGITIAEAIDHYLQMITGRTLAIAINEEHRIEVKVPERWEIPEMVERIDTVLKHTKAMLQAVQEDLPVGIGEGPASTVNSLISMIDNIVGRPEPTALAQDWEDEGKEPEYDPETEKIATDYESSPHPRWWS